MILSRMTRLREIKKELERIRIENSALRDEMSSLKAHFAQAIVAMEDLRSLPDGGKLILVDGWNVILGAKKDARSRKELAAKWREYLKEHQLDRVWIVFDGPKEDVAEEERLRISYTGGSGPHRADRFICDYLRAAKYLGFAGRAEVRTNDRELQKEVAKLL
jgi:hypothetical protein